MNCRHKIAALTLTLCLLLSGCRGVGGDSPNRRAVAQILALDTVEDDFLVTARILEENGQSGGYITIQQQGETISEAISEIGQMLGKELFLRDVRLVLFGEEICEDGIGQCRQYLTRGFQIRPRVSLAAVKGQAQEYLQPDNTQSAPVDEIVSVLQWSPHSSGAGTTVMALERDMNANGGDGFLPFLKLDTDGKAELSGGMLLHEQKKSCLIGQDEVDDLRLLALEPEGLTLVVQTKEGTASIELLSRKESIKAMIRDGLPTFTFSGCYWFRLLEWNGGSISPDVNLLEKAVRQKMILRLEDAIRLCVFDAGTDLIQLDNTLRRDQPQWWQEKGKEWRTQRENSAFYLDIECRMER